ncbi:hypothetical protein TNCV_2092161 [Trichonephila clavipes]|nr:hypothetical protein TNCV_2092161 [Trichonephila clavipes]
MPTPSFNGVVPRFYGVGSLQRRVRRKTNKAFPSIKTDREIACKSTTACQVIHRSRCADVALATRHPSVLPHSLV